MKNTKTSSILTTVLFAAGILFLSPTLFGHGSVGDPVSRVYQIFLENPETPMRSVSIDAIAVGGTQPFYDWSEINRLVPAYDGSNFEPYRVLIPDGQLASAGRLKYAGLDLVREDWPATSVNQGSYPVVFDAHVPHDPSYFLAFITRDSWSADQSLKWDDLVPLSGADQVARDGHLYRFNVDLPNRTGRHILYVIWQRIDPAGEAFFSISDLDFGDGSGYGNPPDGNGAYDEFTNDYITGDIEAEVMFSVQNDWNSGFTAEFTITNSGQIPINGWTLEFDLARNITNFWNADFVRREGDRYTVIHDLWNQAIPVGGSASFGFQGDPGNVSDVDVTNIQLNGLSISGDGDPDDPTPVVPNVSGADIEVIEGDVGQTAACFNFVLSNPADAEISFGVNTVNGTSTSGEDYHAVSEQVVFASGESNAELCINVIGDTIAESDETFFLEFVNPNGLVLDRTNSVATIRNDDPSPDPDPEPDPQPDPEADEILFGFTVNDNWGSGYTATITLTNNSVTTIDGWTVNFDLDVSLVNFWNATDGSKSNGTFTFRNESWNATIAPGASVNFGIQTDSSADTTPENVVLNGDTIDDDSNDGGDSDDENDSDNDGGSAGPLEILVVNGWNSGFTVDATLTVDQAINGWEITFDFLFGIADIWNAEIVSQSGNTYTVRDAGYNASVQAGSAITFGFNATSGGPATGDILYPSNVSVNGADGGNPDGSDDTDSGTDNDPNDTDGGINDPEPAIPGDGKPKTGDFNYGEAMQKSLYFYDTQRSGELTDDYRVVWRGNSALTDGADVGLDLTGGFYDAGDHVKFGFPGAFSFTVLGWSLADQRNSWVETSQNDELLDLLKWKTDYLMRAHVRDASGNTVEFYGQVGGGHIDHAYWGPPETMSMNRPAFKVTRSQPGSELTAESAAALAAASLAIRPADPTYADLLVEHARALYNFADTYRERYTNAINDAASFYNSWSGYEDELVWGAIWLYRATDEQPYLDKAEQYFNQFHENSFQSNTASGNYSWTINWDDKRYGSVVLLAALTGKAKYKEYTEKWLDYWTIGYNGQRVNYSPGGQAHLDQWGSLRYSANSAFLALWYADNVRDHGTRYRDFGEAQINYALGDNPEGRSYVVGFGTNPPINPHHRAAHGSTTNNIHSPVTNQHILYGALVGGPSQPTDGASYVDDRTDFRANEVALDYNAGYTAALAILYEIYGGKTILNFPVGQ